MTRNNRIKDDSDNTNELFLQAEVHDSVTDVRKERDEFKSKFIASANEAKKLTAENAWLKSDNALLKEADILRTAGAGILSVCGGLTLIPDEYRLVMVRIAPEMWSFAYFVFIIAAIAMFGCGVWLRRDRRKTALSQPENNDLVPLEQCSKNGIPAEQPPQSA